MSANLVHEFYICPKHKTSLHISANSKTLRCDFCGLDFPSIKAANGTIFTSFEKIEGDEIGINSKLYNPEILNQRYQNFLNWLFATFKTDEYQFRKSLFLDLGIKKSFKILITSLGNGDDVISLTELYPSESFEIFAQDLSPTMCEFASKRLQARGIKIKELNVSNLSRLPYKSEFFDLVFHFGGINWIQDKQSAISEMTRVAKDYGQIGIIDESVGEWLRDHDFGKMMINNNSLWEAKLPLKYLPFNANNVTLKYVLENCFYFLKFIKDPKFPKVDTEIEHKGPRGGSIITRYFGQLEGINPDLAKLVREKASSKGLSVSRFIEQIVTNAITEI